MILRHARRHAMAAAAAGLLLAGCVSKIEDRTGYVVDEALVTAIQPGVDKGFGDEHARPPELHRPVQRE